MRSAAALVLPLLALTIVAKGDGLPPEGGADDKALSAAKILNGRNATRGRYPYIASLRFPYVVSEPVLGQEYPVVLNEFVCTGVLIKPDIVLTSAWCVIHSGVWPLVKLDSYETYRPHSTEVRAVIATAWHGQFKGAVDDVRNDVALMLLNAPITSIQPVRLPPSKPSRPVSNRTPLVIAGWGYTANKPQAAAANLKEATQFLLPPQTCAKRWSSGPSPLQRGGWFSGEIVCGAYDRARTALCYGDAGAPLILKGPSPVKDTVLGLGSQSDCKGSGQRGGSIYSNLAHYNAWIAKGITSLRRIRGVKKDVRWVIARKSEFPSWSWLPGPCKGVGHRCTENEQCCTGFCAAFACLPPW